LRKVDFGLEDTMANNHVIGISAQEQHMQCRIAAWSASASCRPLIFGMTTSVTNESILPRWSEKHRRAFSPPFADSTV
jgi:hypothetical protein